MDRIGFKFNNVRKREEYEAMIAGFCDCLFDSLMDMEVDEGDKFTTELHGIIYGDIIKDEEIKGDE